MNYTEFTTWLDGQRDLVDFILHWVNLMNEKVELAMDPVEFSQMFNRLRNLVAGLNEGSNGDYLLVGYEALVTRYKLSLYVCNGVDVDNVYTLVVKKL